VRLKSPALVSDTAPPSLSLRGAGSDTSARLATPDVSGPLPRGRTVRGAGVLGTATHAARAEPERTLRAGARNGSESVVPQRATQGTSKTCPVDRGSNVGEVPAMEGA